MSVSVRIELADGQSTVRRLAVGRTLIGRSVVANVVVDQSGVSREHAVIMIDASGTVSVEDLGSRNGTRLNGTVLTHRAVLADGDRLGVGDASLTVQLQARQAVETLRLPADALTPPELFETEAVSIEDLAFPAEERALRMLYRLTKALDPRTPAAEVGRRVVTLVAEELGADRVLWRAGDDEAALPAPFAADAAVLARLEREPHGVLVSLGEGAGARSAIAVGAEVGGSRALLYAESPSRRGTLRPRDLDFAAILVQRAAALIEVGSLVAELRAVGDRLVHENRELRAAMADRMHSPGTLGASPRWQEVMRGVHQVAASDATVLVTGESGTGKELIAREIHFASPRRDRPFVTLNCAALPESIIEAELFGIERGVATGVDRRVGKFEAADDGTIFLDEIGEMPLALQAKLLRVLQERVVERVGARTGRPMRARVLAATNRDLAAEVAAKRFRSDLFYRLAVVPFHLPPLRDRPGDVRVLAEAFLAELGTAAGRWLEGFTPGAMAALAAYPWAGNVRELRNEIERIVAVWPESEARRLVGAEDLAERIRTGAAGVEVVAAGASANPRRLDVTPGPLKERIAAIVADAERELILAALAETGDNRLRAAEVLSVSRETLRQKMLRYGID